MDKPLDFARTSRKHKVTRAHVLAAIEDAGEPVRREVPGRFDRLYWVGVDDRGIELEIVAVDYPDAWMVIHAMPTSFRAQGG